MLLLLFPRVVVASAMLVASSDVTAAAQLQGSGTLLAPSSVTASEQEIDGGSLSAASIVTAAPDVVGSASITGSAATSAAGQVAGASTIVAPAILNASEQEIDSGLLAGASTATSAPVVIGAAIAHADSQISAQAADAATALSGDSVVAAQPQVIAAAQLDASSLVSAAGANTVIPSPAVGSGGRNSDTWYSASSSEYWEPFRGTVERPAAEPIQASGTAVGGSDVIAAPCQIARAIVNAEARLYARPRLLAAISPVAGDSEVYARGVPTTPSMDELLILLEEAA